MTICIWLTYEGHSTNVMRSSALLQHTCPTEGITDEIPLLLHTANGLLVPTTRVRFQRKLGPSVCFIRNSSTGCCSFMPQRCSFTASLWYANCKKENAVHHLTRTLRLNFCGSLKTRFEREHFQHDETKSEMSQWVQTQNPHFFERVMCRWDKCVIWPGDYVGTERMWRLFLPLLGIYAEVINM
jgi:hypothetical protein